MTKTISILLLALTTLTAAPVSNFDSANSSSRAILYFRFGTDGNEHNETAIAFNNATSGPAKVSFEMYNPNGQRVEVPYRAQGGGVTRLARATFDVPAHGSGVAVTSSKGFQVTRGWLRVISEPAGAVMVTVHGRTQMTGRSEETMYSIRPTLGAAVQTMGPFDNGTLDHFVLANNSSAADRVTLIARARNGAEMCRTAIDIGAAQYYKQFLASYLPCTAGKSTNLEVISETRATASMGFIYPKDGSAITVLPQTVESSSTESLDSRLQDLFDRFRKTIGQ